ncbi:MAG: DUF1127 domain-containing protein [Rhizobiaceae bacterium]|nr:DUF1127 domain-containing protein [Rhizobiaceae bacterium]
MAVFEAREPLGFGASWIAAARRVSGIAAVLYRDWNNRRQFRRLQDMSDWELADIGLTRDDLRAAWNRRPDTDPTAHLAALRRQRDALEDAAGRVS